MRIAVVTPPLPLRDQPYRGRPIFETLKALYDYADLRIFSPVAIHRGWKKTADIAARVKDWGAASELPVTYIPYPATAFLSRPWNGQTCIRHLYPHVAGAGAELILSFWAYPEGYAGVQMARRLGLPSVLSCRGSDLRRTPDPFTRLRVMSAVQSASAVCAVSNELRMRAIQAGASESAAFAIHNGCDRSVFHPKAKAAVREALDVPEDAQLVLYVGRLVRAKGIPDLLASFAELSRRRPRLRLVLLGDGPLRPSIESFARRSDARGRIRIAGVHDPAGVALWMNAADLLCLPSHSEGCPNVVIEAISCGCPVVASDVGGTPELLTPECGLLTPPRDVKSLTSALDACLERPWDRNRISAEYQRGWDVAARETFTVCEDVLRQHAQRRAARGRSRLKITVVTPYFPTSEDSYRGHSAIQTLRVMKEMADIDVICPIATYPRGASLLAKSDELPAPTHRPEGIPTVYLPYRAVPALTRPINGEICRRRLRPLLEKSRPDVILNYWLYPEGYSALRCGEDLGIPVVVGSIGSDLRRIRDPFTRRLVKQTLVDAPAVITVSEDLRRIAIQLGAAAGKVTTILNGYDSACFHPGDRDTARRVLGVEADAELLVYVGSLLRTKGLRELAAAFGVLAGKRPRARLAVAGEGLFRAEFEERARRAGVSEKVLLLGRRRSDEVADWMRAADIFCLPSYSEGCPNVIVEALACGTPVVASDIGGIPELVGPGDGILVPTRTVEPLADALERALDAPWDRADIAARSRRSWKEVAEETLQVCSRLAGRCAVEERAGAC